jgi:hypothetical protein
MVGINDYATLAGLASDQCFNLAELRDLGERERAFLEDTARKIEGVVVDARITALESGLDLEQAQKGIITTLIVTTASFVTMYNRFQESEAVAFYSVMRCMAEALIDVSNSSPRVEDPRRTNYRPS